MAWSRKLLAARAAVGLTTLVAVLSVLTGILHIGNVTFEAIIPLEPYIPDAIQRTAGFTGTLTGFLMLGAAYGLKRGLRVAWYAVIVLLPFTALQGVVQSSPVSLPLVALSLLSMPTVALHRQQFDRELALSTTQLAAAIALIGTQAYGTVGTYILRDDFQDVTTILDAFYYTIVTATTVGYGDAHPVGPEGRLFAMSVVVFGTASFAVALGSLLGPAIEARLSKALGKMSDSQLELLEDHVLILGDGELTAPVVSGLQDSETDFVVITANRERVSSLSERGVNSFTGNPSDEEPMRRAKIGNARALVVATNDDAQDALAILTARQLQPDIRIVAAATDRENVSKLRHAGADTVISPATIGGQMLVDSALGGSDTTVPGLSNMLGDDSSET
ncbi:NAD-binding protein [Natranaeroarchaeum sulfidigenes]|uniref:Kef-type K+ transport system, predicted NAD-binding component n=1 Tax=Natranaeroarchaeum sulfidigenes TaxID=2784880 RepID=A0A897MS67_9EURY|nr:NAD-binding protein [Natranaeroarchaeum sulfidigenes]QSG03302.1 Kef-type K+ transport system, predicted NAD-binding component [Natranaeroarchaeum sulfidigenes]